MTDFTVIYDANILYPAPLRDLMMWLAMEGIYLARWTADIHDEWMRSVRRDRPDLSDKQLQRTQRLMDRAVPDCLVRGYRPLIDGITLADPGDRHVVAAAIKAGASLIVTYNIKHFPDQALVQHGIKAMHPDDFLVDQFDLHQAAVCRAFDNQRASLKNPPQSADQLLSTLESLRLPRIVERLRGCRESL